jgi:hypothetical protein
MLRRNSIVVEKGDREVGTGDSGDKKNQHFVQKITLRIPLKK